MTIGQPLCRAPRGDMWGASPLVRSSLDQRVTINVRLRCNLSHQIPILSDIASSCCPVLVQHFPTQLGMDRLLRWAFLILLVLLTVGDCDSLTSERAVPPFCHENRPIFGRSFTHFEEFDLIQRTIAETDISGWQSATRACGPAPTDSRSARCAAARIPAT